VKLLCTVLHDTWYTLQFCKTSCTINENMEQSIFS